MIKRNHRRRLVEGVDYTIDDAGRMVLSRKYHLQRGFCCGNTCMHCPYDGIKGSTKISSQK